MSHIAGRSILVIEDEPLVALDIMETFERVGAHVQLAPTRSSALERMGPEVAAAVLDFGLNFGDGHPLYDELKSRGIPFVIYSGYSRPKTLDVPFIEKPSEPKVLVEAVETLLAV